MSSSQNIHSSRLNYKGQCVIGSGDIDRLYHQIMNQWTDEGVWTYCRHTDRLIGMTIDEFVASVGSSFQFQIATKHVSCVKENNTETVAKDGRKWYQLVIQPTRDCDLETTGWDAASLMLFGLMVDGFVFHFAEEHQRDVMWCKINNKCFTCKIRQPAKHYAMCIKCAKNPVLSSLMEAAKHSQPELLTENVAKILAEELSKPPTLPTEVERMLEQIKKEDEERMANEWGEWLIKNEPEPVKVVVKPKNPPRDPNRKNIPAKPPAFVRTPAGCQISNHLAVKKWMDKYGNK